MIIDPLGIVPIERGGTGATTVEEAKEKLGIGSSGETGKDLTGQTVSTTKGVTVTAGTNAEIFNDYRERTYTNEEESHSNYGSFGNVATGTYSHAEGFGTTASGNQAHSEGKMTIASGNNAHAEGFGTDATGVESHAEGSITTASGTHSHAEGATTTASGAQSHAEGSITTASGKCSHAEGYQTTASGDYSHASGYQTTASRNCSVAMGSESIASGDYSVAIGYSSTASGKESIALGDAGASGFRSFAVGWNCTAEGAYATAMGSRLEANSYQSVIGRYNKSSAGPTGDSDTSGDIFIVGNGGLSMSNAFRVTTAGKPYGLAGYSSSGADYAEYFEWLDGNSDNEDRRGYFVTLDKDKIRKATDKDEYILGIVSATPAVEGDSQSENWSEMYLKDVFGEKLIEIVEVEETTDEHGNIIPKHTDRRWILNPEYDSSLSYENRENRKEWSAIGLMGKLVVIDDGTCQENGYCRPNKNGIATASETGYRVMKRLDENHVRILLK